MIGPGSGHLITSCHMTAIFIHVGEDAYVGGTSIRAYSTTESVFDEMRQATPT